METEFTGVNLVFEDCSFEGAGTVEEVAEVVVFEEVEVSGVVVFEEVEVAGVVVFEVEVAGVEPPLLRVFEVDVVEAGVSSTPFTTGVVVVSGVVVGDASNPSKKENLEKNKTRNKIPDKKKIEYKLRLSINIVNIIYKNILSYIVHIYQITKL